jgi:predicted TPR repeat methyltransferase
VELNPRSIDALHALAQAQRELGQLNEAAATLREALKLDPRSAPLRNTLGVTLMRQGHLDAARNVLEEAIALAPDDPKPYRNLGPMLLRMGLFEAAATVLAALDRIEPPSARTQRDLGLALLKARRLDEAIERLHAALRLEPGHVAALCNLGLAMEEAGRLPEARQLLERAAAAQPQSPVIAYHLGALGATAPPPICPPDYLIELFDDYAPTFDRHLVGKLHYRGPQLLFDAVARAGDGRRWDVLDLGCGTGLCGVLFRPVARTLTGVDLAPRMIDAARARGVYDQLRKCDVTDALRELAGTFDLLLAADVFIYIGDLGGVFAAAAQGLRPGGLFAFTIELLEEGDFALQRVRRYAQSRAYIHRLASQHDLRILIDEPADLREGHDGIVGGRVFVLRRGEGEPGMDAGAQGTADGRG